MSKAILVLDEMPKSCKDCPCESTTREFKFNTDYSYVWYRCANTGRSPCDDSNERPDWCPLKEMPKKKAISGTQIIKEAHEKNIDPARYAGYCAGWNDCINSIGGDDNAD